MNALIPWRIMTYESLEDLTPSPDVHSALAGIAWLRGVWTGTGHRQLPGEEPTEIAQRVEFVTNGQAYLYYLSQSWTVDDDGSPGDPIAMETGFWRANPDASVEVVLAAPEGVAEVWYGKVQVHKIELVTDAVARTQGADVPVTGGHRLYGLMDGDLWYSYDRATEDAALQPHLWAHLRREQ